MIRGHKPFYGKRFIGDTSGMIIHDCLFERRISTIGEVCDIDGIKTKHIRTFSPDKQEQAEKEG